MDVIRHPFSTLLLASLIPRIKRAALGCTIGLLILLQGTVALASSRIEGVRLWRSPEKTRLVFDLSDSVSHKIFSLPSPERLVIDITDTRLPGSLSGLNLDGTPISRLRWAQQKTGNLRIVLDLKKSANSRSFVLKPRGPYKHRLVIDLLDVRSKRVARESKLHQKKRDIIVAIDPGHGGEDPGAVGHGGVREKDVVLAISRELFMMFKRSRGFRPVMIRDGDYYVALRERTRKARKHSADVLLSIHADAFRRQGARGSSVFTLSQRGASSETARWLADRENTADLVGGEEGVSLDDKDDVLAGVLLDLSMTDSQNRSNRIAKLVLERLGKINRLHKRQVEQAAFVVLKSPDIPSILVETGFITNPGEAKRLSDRAHQRRLAQAIHSGVQTFFVTAPPAGSLLASDKRFRGTVRRGNSIYTVQQGDTLSGIAQRFRVRLDDLLLKNRLQAKDTIRVGQGLRIPEKG
ncbi:MAG: N-acetylmuramoyl-L-alanine amidase [Kistimonas sp.]|nr:N-acetylmuramoyl-L-alanine amidase [Kistimonas sp.]